MSTAKIDTLKPISNNGSLTLQGDSSGSGVTGATVNTSGDVTLSNDLISASDTKIKLGSAGGVYESDGSTAILTESSGSVTLQNVTLASTVSGQAPEGTAVKSTGESGGTKFLREDGDGTCSWQAPSAVPTGLIAPMGMSSAPTGWLVCDGSAVSRSTYAGLFSIIGTTWGTGDGSSTFNVPDLRGAVLRGTGTAGVSSDYVGPNVGAYQDDQNAEHNHSASSSSSGSSNSTGSHQHNAAGNTPFAGSHFANLGAFNGFINTNHQKVASAGSHSHSISVSTSTSIGNQGSTEARVYNRGVQYCIKF